MARTPSSKADISKAGTAKADISKAGVAAQDGVTRTDIEAKLEELRGTVEPVAEQAKGAALVVGAAVVVGLVLTAYVLGRRRGKKRQTVVEIKRV
jgi:hypothetical protein